MRILRISNRLKVHGPPELTHLILWCLEGYKNNRKIALKISDYFLSMGPKCIRWRCELSGHVLLFANGRTWGVWSLGENINFRGNVKYNCQEIHKTYHIYIFSTYNCKIVGVHENQSNAMEKFCPSPRKQWHGMSMPPFGHDMIQSRRQY